MRETPTITNGRFIAKMDVPTPFGLVRKGFQNPPLYQRQSSVLETPCWTEQQWPNLRAAVAATSTVAFAQMVGIVVEEELERKHSLWLTPVPFRLFAPL